MIPLSPSFGIPDKPPCYVRQCALVLTLLVYVKLSEVSRGNFTVINGCKNALNLHNSAHLQVHFSWQHLCGILRDMQ